MADLSHRVMASINQEGEIENYQFFKNLVLNYLFRHFCFVDEQNRIKEFRKKDLETIGKQTNLSNQIVFPLIDQFLKNAHNLKTFFAAKPIVWEYNKTKLVKKVRIYLHKVHRIAPIFSYARAKENLEIFHLLLEQKNHWPHITTQIALVIFITDRNDKANNKGRYIIQKNLRAFCDCSAYAFHRARNTLHINKMGQTY